MARFLVHIGDGKCGSTAIQLALAGAQRTLAAQGILFHTFRPNSNHAALAVMAGHTIRNRNLDLSLEALETVKGLSAQVKEHYWTVISAESLVSLDPARFDGLLKLISGEANEAHVICYVREPTSMYLSWVQQQIKASHLYLKPHKYKRRVDKDILRWADYFGHSNAHVRLFCPSRLKGGNAVDDFAAIVSKITGTDITLDSTSANGSMTAEQMRVIQMYRRELYPAEIGQVMPMSESLNRLFSDLNEIRKIGNEPQLSDEARDVVSANSHEVIENLNAAFPDLAMPSASADHARSSSTYPWDNTSTVSAILGKWRKSITTDWRSLLPELNPDHSLTDEHAILAKWLNDDKNRIEQFQHALARHRGRISQRRND